MDTPTPNQPEAMKHPEAEMMSLDELKGFRHVDREADPIYPPEHVDDLADVIRQGKLHDPLQLHYDHQNRWGILGEGHHRLLAAERAGATHLPVRVVRTYPGSLGSFKDDGVGRPMNIKPDALIGVFKDHVPASTKPSSFVRPAVEEEAPARNDDAEPIELHRSFWNHPDELAEGKSFMKNASDIGDDPRAGWTTNRDRVIAELKARKDPRYAWDSGDRTVVSIKSHPDDVTPHPKFKGEYTLNPDTEHEITALDHHRVDEAGNTGYVGPARPSRWNNFFRTLRR